MSNESTPGAALSGKPLVFAFMAATVVAVVIFLCGVMVGRGVQARLIAGMAAPADPTRVAPRGRPREAQITGELPQETLDALSYPRRLEAAAPVPETVHEPVPAAPAPTARTGARAGAELPGEPPGPGLAITVGTYQERAAADTVAHYLAARGYPAYVATDAPAGQTRFVVRVGKFRNRRDAEESRARLEREEQFAPVIDP